MRAEEYIHLVKAVAAAGYGGDFDWSENMSPPKDADDFFREYCFVVCNSGMKHTVATRIFHKVIRALNLGESARTVFGHPGKTRALDAIWRARVSYFNAYLKMPDDRGRLDFLECLPWIGPITKFHLAKNFGVNCAKPDRHLERLAQRHGTTPELLCQKLAAETGHRTATVDVVLWRACAIGLIKHEV